MRYLIKYKYRGIIREKFVEAESEEKAKEMLKQELLDYYNNYCLQNNITPTLKNFNKNYKVL